MSDECRGIQVILVENYVFTISTYKKRYFSVLPRIRKLKTLENLIISSFKQLTGLIR
jgi:hypothetical protein